MSEVEVRVGAFKDYDAQVLTGVHLSEEILEAIVHCGIYDVEGRIIEDDPPIARRFLNHPQRRTRIRLGHG
jgi:hypothetical protein